MAGASTPYPSPGPASPATAVSGSPCGNGAGGISRPPRALMIEPQLSGIARYSADRPGQ